MSSSTTSSSMVPRRSMAPDRTSARTAGRGRFLYFAYGSNMLTRRLTATDRAPSAVPRSLGYVEGRRLSFDKVGQDGSGKCDAEATAQTSDRVHGVVFEVAWADRGNLDKVEGLGHGYAAETVEVVTAAGRLSASAYVAIRKDASLRPFHWYKALVLAGAAKHALPAAYVEWLRGFESVADADEDRRRIYAELLSAG